MTSTEPEGRRSGSASRRPRILVVGDVMLDTYVAGRAERLSPEAPVPVVEVADDYDHLGGAANVARQVAAFGADVTLVGVVGDDAAATSVRDHCRALGIDDVTVVDGSRPTTTKQRVVVGRRQLVRLDRESRAPVLGEREDEVVARIVAAVGSAEPPAVVVLSDYRKGVVTERVARRSIGLAGAARVPVLVDAKDRDLRRYEGATLLKANLDEFEQVVGRRSTDDPVGFVADAGPELLRRTGIRHLVVTLGSGGLVLHGADGVVHHVRSAPRDVYDVSGAGDTVMATLAVRLAKGDDLLDAATVANLAAGLAVERPGVSVIGPNELERGTSPTGAKVVDRPRLAQACARWHSEGRRIVFTNGCFDLLHAGHLRLLTQAARHGDVLVVAVDSDRSVRRLKGERRPIVGQDERLALVAALDVVDAVVCFESDELEALVAAVRPAVLVKGADYRVADVVGGDTVVAAGGRVELVELLEGLSTSARVDRLAHG